MFNKVNKVKRFSVVDEQTVNMVGITVIQDNKTGVNYVLGQGATGVSITPLIDKEGKILINDIE